MFRYYLDLAVRSLRRSPILTALMVLAIGLGIGASMTMLTVLNVMTRDPLSGRSAHIYRPHLNPLPLDYHYKPGTVGGPTTALTWPDAEALLNTHWGVHQAAVARGYLTGRSDHSGPAPKSVAGSFTTHDLFAMFGVPFVAGHGWSGQDDVDAAPVAVVTSFWVQQRRRSIGIRRAIGAARGDILRYFQTENFLIVTAGIALGLLLAVLLNLWLMKQYELPRLPLFYLPIGAMAMWLLGQLAVLSPALRGAAVPPVVATRWV